MIDDFRLAIDEVGVMVRVLCSFAAAMLLLGGCHRGVQVAASVPAGPPAPTFPPGVTPQLIASGDSLYRLPDASCQRCHSADATGGANAPSLRTGPWLHTDGTFEKILSVIIDGVPRERVKDPTRRFAMNPRGGPMNLTDAQARALAAYIWSISRAKTATDDALTDDQAVYGIILEETVRPRASIYASRSDSVPGFRVMERTLVACGGVWGGYCLWNGERYLDAPTVASRRRMFDTILDPAELNDVAAVYRRQNAEAREMPNLVAAGAVLRSLPHLENEMGRWSEGHYPGYVAFSRPAYTDDHAVVYATFATRGFATGWMFLLRKTGTLWELLVAQGTWVT